MKNLVYTIAFILVGFWLVTGQPFGEQDDYTLFTQEEVYRAVNEHRAAIGIPPVTENAFTCDIASKRLPEVVKSFSHAGFYKYGEDRDMGEILGMDYTEEKDLVEGWENSPTHKEVMEDDYPFACTRCSGYTCVMIFEK